MFNWKTINGFPKYQISEVGQIKKRLGRFRRQVALSSDNPTTAKVTLKNQHASVERYVVTLWKEHFPDSLINIEEVVILANACKTTMDKDKVAEIWRSRSNERV